MTNHLSAAQWSETYSNNTAITINDSSSALPYPSTITVNNLSGRIQKVNVKLLGFTHAYAGDVDILLVSPAGEVVVPMSYAGGEWGVTNVILELDDGAATVLPANEPLVSGIYRPAAYWPAVNLPAPAPAPPFARRLAAFNTSSPNGVWSLYIADSIAEGSGSLNQGWSLTLTTTDQPLPPALATDPADQNVVADGTVVFAVQAVGDPPLVYQWLFNGAGLPGATNDSLSLSQVQYPQAGAYSVRVTNAYGSVTSAVAQLTVRPSLAYGADTTKVLWDTYGDDVWIGVTNITHDGVDALQSGDLGHSEYSWLETTVDGPLTVSFWWKVSSELDYDFLYFDVDSTNLARISGEVDWTYQSFNLGAGTHTLSWSYEKDSNTSQGQDLAWLDQVSFGGTPPVLLTQPQSQTVSAGATVTLTGAVNGGLPLYYQWWRDGTALAGATDATLNLTNLQPALTGAYTYTLVVSNASGSITSAPVVLTVLPPPVFRWAQTAFVTNEYIYSRSVAVDGAGNVYAAGEFYGNANFNGTVLLNRGTYTRDVYLAKYNSTGNQVWARSAGGTGYDECKKIAADSAGNVYVTGTFYGSATFGGFTLTSRNASTDGYLVKYNSAGTALWARSWGGNDGVLINDMAVDAADNVLLVGYYIQSATFGSITVTATNDWGGNLYLAKYDSAGTCLWVKTAGAGQYCEINRVSATGSTNCYLTGVFSGTNQFGSFQWRNASPNVSDMFLIKCDGSGNVIWGRTSTMASAQWLANDLAGNVVCGGAFQGAIAFGPYTVAAVDTNFSYSFLAKFDADGNALWAKRVGEDNGLNLQQLALDPAGGIYLAASFFNAVIETTVLRAVGYNANLALVKYDAGGNFLFARSAGDQGITIPAELVVTGVNTGVLVGNYSYNTKLDQLALPGSSSHYKLFVTRFAPPDLQSPPVIIQQPGAHSVVYWQPATMQGAASSFAPVTYRWQHNGTILPGVTNATLFFAQASDVDIGNYSLVATNVYGAVTSSPAYLWLNYPPRITSEPRSVIVLNSAPVTFSVEANGDYELVYQWYFNGEPIFDAHQPDYQVTAQASTTGNYFVVISNNYGIVTSAVATLSTFVPATLSDALENEELAWTTSPTIGWLGVAESTDYAISLPVGMQQRAELSTTVTGPCQVSFWWKVSSAANADFLELRLDGLLQFRISGETDWEQGTGVVPEGAHTLNWSYMKTTAKGEGDDRGYLDAVTMDSRIQFSASGYTTYEGANAVLTLQRSGSASGQVTVGYNLASLTAAAGADFAAATGSVTWASGDLNPKTITIPVFTDALVESNETFRVALTNISAAGLLADRTTATVTILDANSPATLRFENGSYTVNESAGAVVLKVLRTGAGGSTINVSFATTNGTALEGLDYGATNGSLTFGPTDDSKTIQVPIGDDWLVEGDKTFGVRLSNPNAGSIGSPGTATVTIRDASYSPEDLYGHYLYIETFVTYITDPDALNFMTILSIRNPSPGASWPGYIELTPSTLNMRHFDFASIPGGGTNTLTLWSSNPDSGGGFGIEDVYASIYEATTNGFQLQQRVRILNQLFTQPPSAGPPTDSGQNSTAPLFPANPYLTNATIIGPTQLWRGDTATYSAQGRMSNGSTNTNVAVVWSGNPLTINPDGVLTTASNTNALTTVTAVVTVGALSRTASVQVVILPLPPLQLRGLQKIAAGPFQFSLAGLSNRLYLIEGSTNLQQWIPVSTNLSSVTGETTVSDPSAAVRQRRYYRARPQ